MKKITRVWLIALAVLLTAPVALADGEGAANIEPGGPIIAGSLGTWTITYAPGPEGIKPGGGLRLQLSGFPIRLFDTPQCTDPAAPNYTTAHCTNPDVALDTSFVQELRGGWQDVQEVQVKIGEPGLSPDDRLTVVFGDTSGGSPGGRTRGQEGDELPVRIYSDTDGDGKYAPLAEFPRVTLAGASAARIEVCAPSRTVVGRPTRIALSARDYRNALATQQSPEVTLACAGIREPVSVKFPEGERAIASAEVVFTRPGVYRLDARSGGTSSPEKVINASEFISSASPNTDADPTFTPELVSVELAATQVAPGSVLRVVPKWRNAGTAPGKQDYRISCHLERRPPQGRALANWDYTPDTPTTEWEPGAEISEVRFGGIAKSIEPGEHALTLGVYYSPAPGKFTVLASYDVCMVSVGPQFPTVTDTQPGRSNPIEVFAQEPQRHLLWGDLHCHTENSGDGSGSVRGLYTYARDVSRLDFCACADHGGPGFPADKWQHIQQMAREFYEPGEFVSILGYELSNVQHGDKNVYFVGDQEPLIAPDSGEAEDLFELLQGVDCIAIPHHPAYPVGLRGTDWTRIDPGLVPVVEMCSGHGLGEHLGNPRAYGKNKPMGPSLPGGFAQDALARGLHIGFICSSDDHSGRAGKMGFLAATYADSFDRQGIIDAFRARRCYGSTGARILLDFTADGQPMGSLMDCESPPALKVTVHGTAPLKRVDIVRSGEVCHSETPEGLTCSFEFRDEKLDDDETYYYARVTQADGEMAWSSPVFVRNVGPRPQLSIAELDVAPRSPQVGSECAASVVVRNDGAKPSKPGLARLTFGGPAASPVKREAHPAKSGIGGLMASAGLQVWRWPVDEQSINVFLRWGGEGQVRDCAGSVRIVDAADYYWTPFHPEDEDKFTGPEDGLIQWDTVAEPGTGDGLNIWVRIDPSKRTRIIIDATRGGERRPDEVFTRAGKVEALPFELDLVEYDPTRWIGQLELPAIQPGQTHTIAIPWKPQAAGDGKLRCEIVDPDSGRVRLSREGEDLLQVR